jgi:hypothetical protein
MAHGKGATFHEDQGFHGMVNHLLLGLADVCTIAASGEQ